MSQLSKKTVVVLLVVWIILLGATVLGILFFNNNTYNKDNDVKEAVYNTRSYYSFYDNNDLVIDTAYINEDNKNHSFNYIKIDGLKNSQVQNKINKEIYDYANSEVRRNIDGLSMYVRLNAFNILSIQAISSGDSKGKYVAFNYDLNTGKHIEFDDLFTNTANVNSIIYDGVYNRLSTDISTRILSLDKMIEADKLYKQNGMASQWYTPGDVNEYIKEKAEKEKELENVDELALMETRKIVNDDNKLFYIANYAIVLFNENKYYDIVLDARKNMEYFAFYEKYLNNDLYKKDNVGISNMFLSGGINSDMTYARIESIDDYALIDFEKFYNINDNEVTFVNKIIDEYKSKFDKNKFNYLNINSYYYNNSKNTYNGSSAEVVLCTMSKDYYNNTYIKKLFYAKNVDEYGRNDYYSDESDNNFKCDVTRKTRLIINGKSYDELSSLFVDGFDYQGYLISVFYLNKGEYYDEANMNELKKQFSFDFTEYGIIRISNNNAKNSMETIDIEKIPDRYLKVKIS